MKPYVEKRFYNLLSRRLAGTADAAELKELGEILHSHPELQFLYDKMLKPEKNPGNVGETETAYMAHYIKMMYAKQGHAAQTAEIINKTNHKKAGPLLIKLAVAASVLLIIISVWLFLGSNKTSSLTYAKTVTDKRSKSTLVLPDGTVVHLNTNSDLSYSADFGKTRREVTLTGEAYFDVTHNARIPFIVHTSEANIKVLGTIFNVRDYSDETKMEASLLKGSIELSFLRDSTKKILLKPSDKILINKQVSDKKIKSVVANNFFEVTNINVMDSVIAETSWMNNKLAFVNKPLPEIVAEIEKIFDVTIKLENPDLKDYRYTGVFDDTSPDDILNVLQMIKPFRYRKTDSTIFIY